MSIEALLLGMRCNIGCTYCYQDAVREQGNAGHPKYDLAAVKAQLLKEGGRFSVFGGEPLLVPIDDLAELWRWGLETFGEKAKKDGHTANGIQTNGTLITDAHIRLFKRYDVGVGFSIDGPGALNDARWSRTLEETRDATAKSIANLERLLAEGLHPDIIVTLHRLNASPERLPVLLAWLRELAAKGLQFVNLHLLEQDTPASRDLALSADEEAEALLACARLMAEVPLSFLPLTDMLRALRGEDQWDEREDGRGWKAGASCVWHSCDPYTTDAVRGVDGQGNRRNCGRTYKEGVQFEKADTPGFERYLALYHTPQAYGGCAGCRFFFACKGQCPGTGEGGDWRGKTTHCSTLMRVFETLEAGLVRSGPIPLSLRPERVEVERGLVAAWLGGGRSSITRVLTSSPSPATAQPDTTATAAPHEDVPHEDTPHEDHEDADHPVITHDDHTDVGARAIWQTI